MKRALIIDADSPFALAVARELALMPAWQVDVASRVPLVPLGLSRYCRKLYHLPLSRRCSNESYAECVLDLIKQLAPDVIVPIDEGGIGLAIQYREAFGTLAPLTPLPTAASFEIAKDKALFAAFTQSHHLPHPRTVALKSPDDAAIVAATLPFPILLKPCRSGYGAGIQRFAEVDSFLKYARSVAFTEQAYLAQEEIPGDDIDCSLISVSGQVVAATVQRPLCPAKRAFSPASAIEILEHEPVLKLAQELAGALAWSGVAHIDMRIDQRDGQLYLIEVNPRFWGSLAASVRAGVNFPQIAVQLALGEQPVAAMSRRLRYAGGQSLWAYLRSTPVSEEGPLRFSETVLPDILRDPGPFLYEIMQPDWLAAHPQRTLRNAFGLAPWLCRCIAKRTRVEARS
jgi:predicted ATP-grasp superfamily ATP-dependent carboligase